ncbi:MULTISPECIES: esterase-like activity of phytase family protein [unclassified Coleofasciculus]|uniref:esterase-like activity of phytase family protein n=2 Tax=unclassified Coleofasciculus TaxID=2692782 RepID=UPI001883100D|nr:esterase-like activity of phytase family protein [Coleofasciculus sp. LEGE 07081]MBE9148596.1 esterase-like activity of phytase family protein [Coleofasciculus sp. LEGE 07092]
MTQLINPNRSRLQASRLLFSLLLVAAIAFLTFLTTSCGSSQARTAEQRTFLDLSLNFLGEYQLPKMTFEDTQVGGLSALSYDRKSDRFLALSDDRSSLAPARFYTLKLSIDHRDTGEIGIENVEVENVTFLKNENGETYTKGSIDPEGIALSPRGTVFVSSEGVPSQEITPFIREFDRQTGQQQESLRIPERYLPNDTTQEEQPPRGIQENLGFESLTFEPLSLAAASGDPFRLFTATESALFQDSLPPDSENVPRLRLMHYLIGNIAPPTLVAEHLYLLNPAPKGAIDNGLTELVTLDTEGRFLSLERSYGLFGAGAKIFQVVMSGATDTSNIASLKGDISRVDPVKKKLLLDLSELGIYLDNLEGMTLGPRLPDGSQSLVLVSDNNFSNAQVTQFLLFSLKAGNSQSN